MRHVHSQPTRITGGQSVLLPFGLATVADSFGGLNRGGRRRKVRHAGKDSSMPMYSSLTGYLLWNRMVLDALECPRTARHTHVRHWPDKLRVLQMLDIRSLSGALNCQ